MGKVENSIVGSANQWHYHWLWVSERDWQTWTHPRLQAPVQSAVPQGFLIRTMYKRPALHMPCRVSDIRSFLTAVTPYAWPFISPQSRTDSTCSPSAGYNKKETKCVQKKEVKIRFLSGHTNQLSCGICLICRVFRLKNWSLFWPEWNKWWVLCDCGHGLVSGTAFFSGQRGQSAPPGSDSVAQRRHQ